MPSEKHSSLKWRCIVSGRNSCKIGTRAAGLDGGYGAGVWSAAWQHQHDIDELARMERICLDLAEESTLSLERGALIEMPAGTVPRQPSPQAR
jgi:hypothetical protein